MLRRRMTTLAFILSEVFPLDGFRCNFVSALYLKYPLVYYHDTLQLCKPGHDDVSHTGMTTLACILFHLFILDCLSCNALYFEYHLDYFHETIRFCRRGHDNVLCIQNMAALIFIPPVSNSPPPPPPPHLKKFFFSWLWILYQNSLTRELKIKFVRHVL